MIKHQDLALTANPPAWPQKIKPNPLQESLCIKEKLQPPGADVVKSVTLKDCKDVAQERISLGVFQGRMCGLNDFLFDFFLIS